MVVGLVPLILMFLLLDIFCLLGFRFCLFLILCLMILEKIVIHQILLVLVVYHAQICILLPNCIFPFSAIRGMPAFLALLRLLCFAAIRHNLDLILI